MAELVKVEEQPPTPIPESRDIAVKTLDGPKPMAVLAPATPELVPAGSEPVPLFPEPEMAKFLAQWSKIQTGFVDEPRQTVAAADKLVESVMQRLTEGFASERSGLEKQWDRGDSVSTEDLRLALQRYRSFFVRLLKL